MKVYRSREGDVTSVDSKTQLSTLGSETAPGPLLVPSNAKKLSQVIAAAVSSLAAAARTTHFIRLEGPGLQDGPEVIAIGADGAQVATGAEGAKTSTVIDLNADVVPNQEILIFGESAGADMGQTTMGATLVFEI